MGRWIQAQPLSLENAGKETTVITRIILFSLRLRNCGVFLRSPGKQKVACEAPYPGPDSTQHSQRTQRTQRFTRDRQGSPYLSCTNKFTKLHITYTQKLRLFLSVAVRFVERELSKNCLFMKNPYVVDSY